MKKLLFIILISSYNFLSAQTIIQRDADIEKTLQAFEATKKKLDAGAYKSEKIPDMAEKH